MKFFYIPTMLFVLFVSVCFSQINETGNFEKVSSWKFSQKDFDSEINEEAIKKGKHKSEVVRRANTDADKILIRKAEALYSEETRKNKDYVVIDEEQPYWSGNIADGVKIATVISTRAIEYYQKISKAFRDGGKVTKIKMSETDFIYNADIQHYDKYEIAGEKFSKISVVKMKIEWSQICGNLCGFGFNSGKIVVFNKDGEPIAFFINYGSGWVS